MSSVSTVSFLILDFDPAEDAPNLQHKTRRGDVWGVILLGQQFFCDAFVFCFD